MGAFLRLGRLMAALQGSILPKCPGRGGGREWASRALVETLPSLPSWLGGLPLPAHPSGFTSPFKGVTWTSGSVLSYC